ncbi:hypothetical protein [Streptomyces sp. N35]|uniref:hypothetical protein n=1 Tax=Streptomyces sp. N35 TaxID=2795730 RepID=UPI0018F31923|nr:hypothetical protein [Streptomyces sp. N35]
MIHTPHARNPLHQCCEPTRCHRLLGMAEPLYRTFTDHPYDRALSCEVIETLAQAIDNTAAYGSQLAEFTEHFHARLERNLADYGPTSAHALKHGRYGRYRLAGQPESLIVFERLSQVRSRFRLRSAWNDSELPETMLTDMGQIWGVAL